MQLACWLPCSVEMQRHLDPILGCQPARILLLVFAKDGGCNPGWRDGEWSRDVFCRYCIRVSGHGASMRTVRGEWCMHMWLEKRCTELAGIVCWVLRTSVM